MWSRLGWDRPFICSAGGSRARIQRLGVAALSAPSLPSAFIACHVPASSVACGSLTNSLLAKACLAGSYSPVAWGQMAKTQELAVWAILPPWDFLLCMPGLLRFVLEVSVARSPLAGPSTPGGCVRLPPGVWRPSCLLRAPEAPCGGATEHRAGVCLCSPCPPL